MAEFTVIGLSTDDGLAIAGVVYGHVDLADASYASESMGLSRWALPVQAETAQDAEQVALAAWEEECNDGGDDPI